MPGLSKSESLINRSGVAQWWSGSLLRIWLKVRVLPPEPSSERKISMSDYNFEMFTERLRKVMTIARDEAKRLGHDFIGTEHVLLALVIEGGGVAAAVLKEKYKVDLQELRDRVLDEMDRRSSTY